MPWIGEHTEATSPDRLDAEGGKFAADSHTQIPPAVNFSSARICKGDARLDASTEARIPQARTLPTVIKSTAGKFRAGLAKTAHLRGRTVLL